jgi:glycosyltransferase involved in cell wall biosynthesis
MGVPLYKNKNVNIVIPVYNEANTLENLLKRVLTMNFVDQIFIADDGSSDGSFGIIKTMAKLHPKITYFSNKANRGKGYCVKKCIGNVKSGIIIIQDADLEYYPEDYLRLLAKLGDGVVVYGTRMTRGQKGHRYRMAKLANAFLTSLFNLLYGQNITDINTCYKVFTKEMLGGIKLKEDRFLIEPEISVKLAKKGYRIKDVPIRYKGRTYREGKKIRALDGLKQAIYLIASLY